MSSVLIPCPHCDRLNRVPVDRPREQGKCGHCGAPLFAGQPLELSAQSFDRHAGTADLPLVVDFWAPWCGPCRFMAPVFAAAAKEFEPRLRFGKVNADEAPSLATRYNIRSIPTLVLFRGGQEVSRISGALRHSQLRHWIDQHLALA